MAWLVGVRAAQVSRSQLLQHAEQVMSMYTPSKAVLEFRFAGEKGLGAGVTASFYSAVAAELQRRSVNAKVLLLGLEACFRSCCVCWRMPCVVSFTGPSASCQAASKTRKPVKSRRVF